MPTPMTLTSCHCYEKTNLTSDGRMSGYVDQACKLAQKSRTKWFARFEEAWCLNLPLAFDILSCASQKLREWSEDLGDCGALFYSGPIRAWNEVSPRSWIRAYRFLLLKMLVLVFSWQVKSAREAGQTVSFVMDMKHGVSKFVCSISAKFSSYGKGLVVTCKFWCTRQSSRPTMYSSFCWV
jgi:hypothetical protein